jgi:hypothetical protein
MQQPLTYLPTSTHCSTACRVSIEHVLRSALGRTRTCALLIRSLTQTSATYRRRPVCPANKANSRVWAAMIVRQTPPSVVPVAASIAAKGSHPKPVLVIRPQSGRLSTLCPEDKEPTSGLEPLTCSLRVCCYRFRLVPPRPKKAANKPIWSSREKR